MLKNAMSVVLMFGVVAFGAGCSMEVGGAVAEPSAPTIHSATYDGITVVSEVDSAGRVQATAARASGEALLVLHVEGDSIRIQPRTGTSLAAWKGVIPAGEKKELSDWSLLAYAYANGLRPEGIDQTGGVSPQRMSAGTDGQMCIAAGSTWAECTYYLYCRRNWCPFW